MSPLKAAPTSPVRGLKTSVALLCLGFALLLAKPVQTQTQTTQPPDALQFFKNYFVTGSHAVGGVGLAGRGVNGVATGSIPMSGVPEGADVVAAFLYWQAVTKDGTGNAGATGVKFGPWASSALAAPGAGIPLSSEDGVLGKILGTGTPPCWSGGGGTGSSGGSQKTFTYRTDVLRFLRVDEATGKYKVNGAYQVQLPDDNAVKALGASLVVIYRDTDTTKPLKAIVLYDGAYTMDQSTEGMFQSIKGFYDGGASARLTHIVGSGQANKSEIVRFNGTAVATNPFDSSEGPGWDNPTFVIDGVELVGLPTEVTTSVDHEGFSTFDCLTWAATIYETPVKDTDGDGLLDAWESPAPPSDPYGQPLPNLYAMGARDNHKDIFIELGYMKTEDQTIYGGGAAKDPHTHLPTPAAIKLMGDAFKNAPVPNPDGGNGIKLHVDVGANQEYQTGEVSQYIVPEALARGGEALDESITTAGCTRVPGVDSVWSCQFSDYPGTVGWKTGFRYIKDEVIGTTDGSPVPEPPADANGDDPCDEPDSKCVKRFDANRSDMFHYAFFAHAVGMPKSLNACLDVSNPAAPVEVPDVDGFCPAPLVENPAFFTPRTNSGIADFPGRDILVTLGAFSDRYGLPGGTDFMVASTFFHELGHNIDLRHGAWQETPGGPVLPAPNCVPTYLSSMNYLYQLRGLLDNSGKPHLDFSAASGSSLNEASGADGEFSFKYRIGWYAPLKDSYFAYPDPADPTRILSRTSVAGRHCDGSLMTSTDPFMVRVDATAIRSNVDWNANGELDGYSAQDLNFNGRTDPRGSPELPPAFNDWANIRLNQVGAGRNVGGPFIDADGNRAFGPLSADLARADWARADWARADWARADWARADWARADWARADWGDLSQGDTVRYGLARADWARADWARADWARADWARADWGRGDDGRGDLGGGDLFVGNPNIAAGELDHETATLLANTPPYEFSVCIGGTEGCGQEPGVRADWTAPNEGGVLRYVVYRVEGTKLEPGQAWIPVGEVADNPGQNDYWLIDDDPLVKGVDYLYFAVAVYQREIEGTLNDVQSDPSNVVPIKGPNHAPMANAQSVIAAEDTPKAITLTGSDTDSGDVLIYAVTDPAHGTLSGEAPNLTYTPLPNFFGPDSFAFTVSDGTATSAPAPVDITVGAVNDAPAAVGQGVTTLEDTPKVITLTGADVDGDVLTSFAVTTPPAHGTLSGTTPNLTYTPALNYFGPDSFAFTVSDGMATSLAATVGITVTAVNDAPVAVNDTYPMPWPLGTPLTIPAPGVLGNDTDIDGGSRTAVLVSGPSSGALTLNPDGSFTYTPSLPASGSVSFTYRVSDGSATSTLAATVRIVAYSLIGTQNVPPAVITKTKAGSSVPMKWQFKDGAFVVDSSGVRHTVQLYKSGVLIVQYSDSDPGGSGFRYDVTTKTWYFNLQTKNSAGVPFAIGDYNVKITPANAGYLPSGEPFILKLTK